MKTAEKTWSKLCEILEPTVDDEESIEKIRANISTFGITAEVEKPRDLSNIEEDNKIAIYEDVGLEIHKVVKNRVNTVINDIPPACSVKLRRIIIDKDNMHIVCNISYSVRESDYNIFANYSDLISSKEEFVESPDKIAYGKINANKSPSSEGLWDFDGTINKYTNEPYNYWSKGQDTDEPRDIEEWIDFVAEDKGEKIIERNRDEYTVHFHPTKFNIKRNHPYINTWLEIQDDITSKFDIDEYRSLKLRNIKFNREYSELRFSLVV